MVAAGKIKIVCQSCGARYQVSGDKVRGHRFRATCKRCGEIIVARCEEAEGEGSEGSASHYEMQLSSQAVWYVVLDGQPHGPLTALQVRKSFLVQQIDLATYLWRAGDADWQRLDEVGEFADLAGEPKTAIFTTGSIKLGDAPAEEALASSPSQLLQSGGSRAAALANLEQSVELGEEPQTREVELPEMEGAPTRMLMRQDEGQPAGPFAAVFADGGDYAEQDPSYEQAAGSYVDEPTVHASPPVPAFIPPPVVAPRKAILPLPTSKARRDDLREKPPLAPQPLPPEPELDLGLLGVESAIELSSGDIFEGSAPLEVLAARTLQPAQALPPEAPPLPRSGPGGGPRGWLVPGAAALPRPLEEALLEPASTPDLPAAFAGLPLPGANPLAAAPPARMAPQGANVLAAAPFWTIGKIAALAAIGGGLAVATAIVVAFSLSGTADRAQSKAAAPAVQVSTERQPVVAAAEASAPKEQQAEQAPAEPQEVKFKPPSASPADRRRPPPRRRSQRRPPTRRQAPAPAQVDHDAILGVGDEKKPRPQVDHDAILRVGEGGASKRKSQGVDGLLLDSGSKPSGGLPDQPSRSAVISAIKQAEPRVRSCGKTHMQQGVIRVSFLLQPTGTASLRVVGPFAGTPVGFCAVGALERVRYPRFAGKPYPFSYTFQVP